MRISGGERSAFDRFQVASPADLGLICGFAFSATTPARRADIAEYPDALAQAGTVLWYHLNAAHAGTRRWLLQGDVVPAVARAAMESRDERCRIEPAGDGLLVVLNDLTFEARADPDEVCRLWAYVTPQLVLTLRAHPLRSTDRLRSEAREGLRIASGPALLCRLMEYQIEAIRELTDAVTRDIDQAEDRVLAGHIAEQRQSLGRARRMCAHLRRAFGAQSISMQKLIARPPVWLDPEDLTRLASLQEDLAFAVGEAAVLHERAKLLQEELASRVAEETSRNLYVLTIFSAVFMPMTLLSGIFGMNVAGLPGLEGKGSFWWVMLLILVSGGVTFVALLRKRPK